jgi:proteasome assembly chaperone (PAC2) family protein
LSEQKPIFSGRTLVVAFEGWNDATDAASTAVKLICEQIDGQLVGAVDPEEYYDFQFNRPEVSFDEDGKRVFSWPTSEIYVPSKEILQEHPEYAQLCVLVGVEPSRRWKAFIAELIEFIEDQEVDSVLFLGAMLADVPHTRPISVLATSQSERVRLELEVERSQYEGPVGILSILGQALDDSGIPTLALWASVPHYVHNQPSPKATLALLAEVEKYLRLQFDHKALAEEASQWERGIDDLALGDEEMSNYINQLEQTRDEFASPAASGDALALEFEKFLRSKDNNNPGADSPESSDEEK